MISALTTVPTSTSSSSSFCFFLLLAKKRDPVVWKGESRARVMAALDKEKAEKEGRCTFGDENLGKALPDARRTVKGRNMQPFISRIPDGDRPWRAKKQKRKRLYSVLIPTLHIVCPKEQSSAYTHENRIDAPDEDARAQTFFQSRKNILSEIYDGEMASRAFSSCRSMTNTSAAHRAILTSNHRKWCLLQGRHLHFWRFHWRWRRRGHNVEWDQPRLGLFSVERTGNPDLGSMLLLLRRGKLGIADLCRETGRTGHLDGTLESVCHEQLHCCTDYCRKFCLRLILSS